MSPAVHGVGGAGAQSLELVPVAEKLSLGSAAESALDDFYSAQLARSRRERDRLERSPTGARLGSAKWNRQEVYLDEDRRKRALEASRRHLARHPEWYEGLSSLDSTALREVVAMQHYLEVDLEDLSLPEGERRSEDSYSGAGGNICDQMLLDAARSSFVVGGEEFDFSVEVAGHGSSIETNPCEIDQLQQAFADRLVAAVVRCLGDEPPHLLLRAVTTAMSQSGLANVERACDEPQVVVCGGDQQLRYELNSLEAGAWELSLFTRKFGFSQCMICGAPSTSSALSVHEEEMPVTVTASSSVSKFCRISFRLGPEGSVEAEVLELRKDLRLLDCYGRRLPGLTRDLGSRRPFWQPMSFVAQIVLRLCTQCALGCTAVCTSAYLAASAAFSGPRARLELDGGK